MHTGYVKLWRKSIESGMLKNHQLWALWCWCLMKASHKHHIQKVGFQEINLEPGQFVFGRKKASEELNISEQSIRTCMDFLKKCKNLTIKTTNKFSVITIVNWGTYQEQIDQPNQQTNQPLTNHQPTTNQQLTTNKNDKNVKNVKNEKKTTSSDEFLIFWQAYPKKTGKFDALKSWNKMNGKKPEIEKIISAIENQKHSEQWQKSGGQFIPNPSTWLNQGRWEDEVTSIPVIPEQTRRNIETINRFLERHEDD